MRLRALIVVALLLISACATSELDLAPPPSEVEAAAASEALVAARSLWAAAPEDYTITLQDSCVGCEATTLAVRAGEVLSLTEGNRTTVEQMFDTIEESIAGGAEVDVEYDPDLGFPVRVSIDLDGDGVVDVDVRFADLEAMPAVEDLDQLQEARRRWDAQDLDSYRFIMRADCTCEDGGTFDVTVRRGEVDEVIALDDLARSSALTPTSMDVAFDDLEEWFSGSAELIAEGILDVEVRMDPDFGYPRWFRVEGAGLDGEDFEQRFTIIATFDLVGPVDPDYTDEALADLELWQAAFDRWNDADPSDYSFVLTKHCECAAVDAGPFLIRVVDDEFSSAVLQSDGTVVDTSHLFADTIGEVFSVISLAIGNDVDVDVTYHSVLGYPTLTLIDPEAVAVDGGLAFSVTNFERLERPLPPPPVEATGTVSGIVLAGPQCPVETDPPTPGCEDQPVSGAEMLVRELSWTDALLVVSDADGTFIVELKPGSYMFEPLRYEGLLGTAAPFEVEVVSGIDQSVTVSYDTGIR